MTVKDLLHEGKENAITRKELSDYTGLHERTVRRHIKKLRKDMVILNDQDGCGYYISADSRQIKRFVRQEESRRNEINASIKKCKEAIMENAHAGGNQHEHSRPKNKNYSIFIKSQNRGDVK